MEQLTNQIIEERLLKENLMASNSYTYTLPIIMLILTILCTIILILAKKNKLLVKNNVITKRIATTGIIVSLLLGCFFMAIGFSIKKDGVDSDWYIAVKVVNDVYETSSGGRWVDDIWIDGISEYHIRIEGYSESIRIDEDYYYKFRDYRNSGKQPKIYAVFSKNNKVLVWYDASKFNYVGDKLKE